MKNDFWRSTDKHCAVITGASSGIGAEFARMFAKRGYFLVLSGRNVKALSELRNEIGRDRCAIIVTDLSDTKNCIDLFARAKKYNPDILINNAGFGIFGEFTETSLSREIEMIDVNIKAMHILFKLFTKDFVKKDRGYILNVASSAGFLSGPLMSTYYSSKSYVIRQTQAVDMELRIKKSNVHVSVLCPGPVNTPFNKNAGIEGFMKGITVHKCVRYTFDKMRDNKLMIIPSIKMQAVFLGTKLCPDRLLTFLSYILMNKKKRL